MDKAELEKYGFSESDTDVISENDLLLIEHYERLFYMSPIELAQAINTMSKDDLKRFNNATRNYGCNAELMKEKTMELSEYVTVNPTIFGEAVIRCNIFDYDSDWNTLKEMYAEKTRAKPSVISLLFGYYPSFKEHYEILKAAKIIEKSETGLKWNRDKVAAAEYFYYLECEEQSRRWNVVEKVFGFKHLCQCLNDHKEKQQGKHSKHFKEIKDLLKLE